AGVDVDERAAGVELAVQFGATDGAGDRHRQIKSDFAVAGADVEIGCQILRHGELHVAVAGIYGPAGGRLGARSNVGGHVAIPGAHAEIFEAASNADIAIAGVGAKAALQIMKSDVAVAGV